MAISAAACSAPRVSRRPPRLGEAGHGEAGSVTVAALSFGDGRGEIGLDGRGGEQGSDDVPGALLEDAGEAYFSSQGLLGGAGATDAGDQVADAGFLVDQVDERHQHSPLRTQPRVDGLHRDAGLAGDVGGLLRHGPL